MRKIAVPNAVSKRLADFYRKGGSVRRHDSERLALEGYMLYKKGDEIRLRARSKTELRLLRRLLRQAGFNPGRPEPKGRGWRQPLYGREEVTHFLVCVLGVDETLLQNETPTPTTSSRASDLKRVASTSSAGGIAPNPAIRPRGSVSPTTDLRGRALVKLRFGTASLTKQEMSLIPPQRRQQALELRLRSEREIAELLSLSIPRAHQILWYAMRKLPDVRRFIPKWYAKGMRIRAGSPGQQAKNARAGDAQPTAPPPPTAQTQSPLCRLAPITVATSCTWPIAFPKTHSWANIASRPQIPLPLR